MEKTYTLKEVADELGCTYRKARDLVHGGHIRRLRGFRRPMKISARELQRYMNGEAVGSY